MKVTIEKVFEDTYVITEDGLLGAANCYLLVGYDKAMVIDSAYGYSDLMGIIRKITDNKIICGLTHGHMDHADGCWQFDKVYMHSNDRELFKLHTSFDFIENAWLEGVSLNKAPKMSRSDETRKMLDKLKGVSYSIPEKLEGESCFDLGNRKISWIAAPGHTAGSVCYYDEKSRALFTGDSITERVWMFLDESEEVGSYHEGLNEIRNFMHSNNVTKFYPGHGEHSLNINTIDDLIACCDMYQEDNEKGKPFELKIGSGRIFRKNDVRLLAK